MTELMLSRRCWSHLVREPLICSVSQSPGPSGSQFSSEVVASLAFWVEGRKEEENPFTSKLGVKEARQPIWAASRFLPAFHMK